MKRKRNPRLGTGVKSALTRLRGDFTRHDPNEVKGGPKIAKITLPHADKLAEIGRRLEESDVQQDH